ncbi:MAG: alpha/beta hydrolase [Candidatus Gastranaerophilales bacterium]|nr:alpha/beta hydrolase [Candidatus Gastranaerophilales bacterium]
MELEFELVHECNSKGAVLLFHGLTGSPFELKKYARFLFKQGYDIFAPCLPGHGDRAFEIYTVKYQDWLSFAKEKFLNLSEKYEDIFVSGICLGAVLGLSLGIEFPKKIKGIVPCSTTLYLDGWRLPWYNCLMPLGLATIIRFYYNYPECEPYGIKNEKTRAVVKKLLAKSEVGMNEFPMTGFYELLKLSKVIRKNLSNIEAPVLLFHSKEDDLTSTKSAEIVYNKISSKDKEKIILYDSYHMIFYDNEKEFVFNKIAEFLNSHIELKNKELIYA